MKVLCFGFCLVSLASHADLLNHFDFGTASEIGADREMGVIFRIRGNLSESSGWERTYLATFDVSLGSSGDDLDYADVTFHALESERNASGGFITWAWAPIKFKRDRALDMDSYFSIGIVELAGGVDLYNDHRTRVFIQGAVDILSLGASKRYSDGSSEAGHHTDLIGQFGVEGEKYRIVLGGQVRELHGEKEKTGETLVCFHQDGYEFCKNKSIYNQNSRTWGELFLEGSVQVHRHWSLYVRGGIAIYEVENETEEVVGEGNSDEDVFRFVFGATYTASPDDPVNERPWASLR